MAFLLGIDSGTTNVKIILAGTDGKIAASVSAPAEVLSPFQGAKEMDMSRLWETICTLTKRLKAENPKEFELIEGVGISAQGDGMWPIAGDGEPAGNAILWNDVRSREISGYDAEALDSLLVNNSSTALFAGASAMILKWMYEKRPEAYKKIDKVVRCKDWLNFKLTGNILSDYSDYSTCGINIITKKHVPEIYSFLGLPDMERRLPDLIAPTDIVGVISKNAEKESGIKQGTPVIAGMLDVIAMAVGTGIGKTGDGCVVLGTTLCCDMLIDEQSVNIRDRKGSTLCSIYSDKYIRLMAALSGNSTIDWAKSVLAPDIPFLELENSFKDVPPGSRGIIYHPYITGERAPFRDPFACAGFYGLGSLNTRTDMMRAVYEGMVFSLKDCYNALPALNGDIYVAGGGAVSDFTCQLIADMLNKRVVRKNQKELAAHGIIKAVKLGLKIKDTVENEAGADIFAPDKELWGRYNEIYDEYVKLRTNLEQFWQKRTGFM